MSLTTTNIDDIIKLIDQITETLTKSDFLAPQEQRLLEQYREYERCTREIQNMERLLIAPSRGGEYKCIKLIKHYKNKRDSIRTPYDPDKSSILQHKLSKAQAEYIQSTLPPLQKKLDLYLAPRWPEILSHATQGNRFKKEVEQYFIKQAYPVGNNIVIKEKTDVVNELERIKAKLEYQQAKTGQPQHKEKPPLDEIETPISCTIVAGIEKFSKLISDRRQVIEELENNSTNKDSNKHLGKLNAINKELAVGGVAIYQAALLLNLHTKPEHVLHLVTNLGEDEEEEHISKAEDELLRLSIEAKTRIDSNNKPTEGKETKQYVKSAEKAKAEVWSQIAIEVVDDRTIKYKVGAGKYERANCTQLGFLDRRSNRPNMLWAIFLGLAGKNLPSNIKRPCMKSKDSQRICKTLREYFGLEERPIVYNKRNKEWHCKFKFDDPRDWASTLQNENLAD